jgi:predicted dehydrogenase
LGRIGFLEDGWDEGFEITGTNGRLKFYSAMWDHFEMKASRLVHYDNVTGQTTHYNFGTANPFERAIEFFCKNIEAGTQGSQDITTGYDVDELIGHILRSRKERKSLEINWRI